MAIMGGCPNRRTTIIHRRILQVPDLILKACHIRIGPSKEAQGLVCAHHFVRRIPRVPHLMLKTVRYQDGPLGGYEQACVIRGVSPAPLSLMR